MGASKEGMMSVRDKINLVLSNFFSEEDDDPPDTSESGVVKRNPTLATSAVVPPEASNSVSANCLSLLDSPSSGSSAIYNVKLASFSPKLGGESGSQLAGMSPNVKPVSESSGADNLLSNRNQHYHDGLATEEDQDGNQYLLFQSLLARQLRLIESLQKRLNREESTCAEVRKERDHTVILNRHLQKALDAERQTNAEIRIQSNAAYKVKDERITELEMELSKATFRKPVDSKGTSITPPPPHTTLKRIWVDEGQVCETKHNLYIDPPLQKRTKIDMGQGETVPNCLAQTTPKVFLSPPSYLSPRGHPLRQSDSPPQLSPAVTPKSALNTSGRPREIGSFLGEDVNDDSCIGPPDEFQDELEHINSKSFSTSSQDEVNMMRPPDTVYEQRFSTYSPRAQQSCSSTNSATGSSGFVRPSTVKPRHTRFMFPEKRRFMNHTSSSFLPVNKSNIYQYPGPSSDILMSKSSKNTMSSRHFQQHSGIRSRSNNFLNLSRPLTKKAPVVVYPSPPSPATPSSTSHFRSLDGVAAAAAALDPCSSLQGKAPLMPLTPPTVAIKKRKVGRPPGSGLKSKPFHGVRLSEFFTSPTGSSTSPHSGQLPNGSMSAQEPPCPPPPQRFSQRGRLLKPNRARYSPEPDASPNTREKFMTTKRGYFVGEPFVHTDYTEDDEEAALSHDDGGIQLDSSLGVEIDSEIKLPGPEKQISKSTDELFGDGEISSGTAIPLAFVEVPKWRINPIENLSDSDDKNSPFDDMSDEAFMKRHQKLEAKEKQRKRWDSQRMREESYLERLKRKQEERERQKELRRQQRKRNKGRNGASEEETVTPNVEEIKAIHVGTELPVGAFGHPLPLVEKVDFNLVWNVTPVATETSATTPPPQSSGKIVVDSECSVSDDSESKDDIENEKPSTPIMDFCEESSCVPSPPSVIQPSSPSSSSLSLPSIPSPGVSTPPPIIYSACDEFNNEDHSKEIMEAISPVPNCHSVGISETDTNTVIVNDSHGEESVQKETEGSTESKITASSSPVFTVDLVDYVHEPTSTKDPVPVTAECETLSGGETCDISTKPNLVAPSISIPLQSPPPATNSATAPCESNSHLSPSNSTGSQHSKDLRPRNSTVVRFPQVISFPTSSNLSSSTLPLSSQPSSSVSKTSITFFIPNNPLAPRHHRPASSATATSPATNKKSSSSVLSSLTPPTRSEYCKDS